MLEIFEEKKIDHIGPIQWMGWSMIRENTEMSIQRKKTRQMKKLKESRAKKIFLSLGDLLLTLLEYGWVVRESWVWFKMGTHPIWASANILTMFLPGIEWHTFNEQKFPGKYRIKRSSFFEMHT